MKRMLAGMAVLALGATVSTASAQVPGLGLQIGVSGGLSLLQGNLIDQAGFTAKAKDILKNGFNVDGHLALSPALLPFGLRVSGGYEKYKPKSDVTGLDNLSVASGGVNAIFKLPGLVVSPYLTGGVSLDHMKVTSTVDTTLTGRFTGAQTTESRTANKVGFNVGGGLQFNLSGLNTFAEVAYRVTTKASFSDADGTADVTLKRIRLNVGLMFPIG